ncbi:MAG: HTTM domain-containing protein [Polyangiaceae bacterium]|nr:HTTM domain-containing protein [Polyangiaceae bacterium]
MRPVKGPDESAEPTDGVGPPDGAAPAALEAGALESAELTGAPVEAPEGAPGAQESAQLTDNALPSNTGVKPAAARPSLARRAFSRVLAVYGEVDPRSMGLFRILLGVLLSVDLLRRYPDLLDHFTNEGWLTNHYALFQPLSSHQWSLYLAFSKPWEVELLFWLHLAVYLCFTVGYRTRLMHALSAMLLVSITNRNIILENGGYIVLILITVWSLFLPLQRRFSVDALRFSLARRSEASVEALNAARPAPSVRPVRNLAVTALLLQWAVIYFFNAVHKNGPVWLDGTAVHYFLQQDRMITPLAGWVRDVIPRWGIQGMTYGTLVIEFALPVLLLTPLWVRPARWLAWALIILLHLGIDVLVVLGPFSWAMMLMPALLIPARDWERLAAWQRARRRPQVALLDPANPSAFGLARLVRRLDGHGLVRFEEGGPGFAVRRGEQLLTGGAAWWELGKALSVPRVLLVFSWLPGASALLGWLLAGVGAPPPGGVTTEGASPHRLTRALRLAGHVMGQAVLVVLMACAVSQVLIENRAVPKSWKPEKRPEWMTALIVYPRMFQGWSMFAPQPPGEDGVIVVDAITRDGRRVDPLTGEPPTFEMSPARGYEMNQIWCDFQRRIGEHRFRGYLPGFKEYLLRYPKRTGRPEDQLVAFEVWQLTEVVPPPGAPKAVPRRARMLTHGRLEEPTPWPHDEPRPARPAP